jgi:hypothetical protein
MDKKSYLCIMAGICMGGIGAIMFEPDPVDNDSCGTYKVRNKVATAYVLKPPPAEVVYKACPQTTENIDPVNTSEKRVEETPKNEHEPRRHRRHRRHWRH